MPVGDGQALRHGSGFVRRPKMAETLTCQRVSVLRSDYDGGVVMTWDVVRNAGYILECDNLSDGPGMRKSREFLQRVARAFARSCTSYCDSTGEVAFAHRERQIHSVLLPSVSNVANAALMEQPVVRRVRRESRHGWVDYWAQYGSAVFLIEVKHAYCSAVSNRVRSVTQRAWSEALEQLRRIQASDFRHPVGSRQNVVRMALLVVPTYQGSKYRETLETFNKEDAEQIHDTIVNGLSPTPNWSALWLLHSRLQEPVPYNDGSYELYPCVGVIAHVENAAVP